MISQTTKLIIGFVLLFALYHAAEYFVLFTYNPVGFLSFQAAFFIAAWLLAKWQGFSGLAAWGLDNKQGWLKSLFIGMCMGLLLYGGTFAVSLWLGSETIIQVPAFSAVWPQLALFSLGTFFSSFSEDVLTRGYIHKHFAHKLSASAFIFVSSTIYLLNHIYRLADGLETYLYIFLLGVLFAIPLLYTKRLWFTGGMHWIGNITFFYTHSIINVKEGGSLSPNSIFIGCILILIPIIILTLLFNKSALRYKHKDEEMLTA
jgi:membrane protease YdiL (CAAX protease family)